MFIEQHQMAGQQYINQTRAYLDYLEEHFTNIRRAFQELSEACNGMVWVGDDYTWHTLRNEVCYHDVSKFSAEEFTQYRANFFPIKDEVNSRQAFSSAWEHHYKSNEHHWEFISSAPPVRLDRYLVHMVVDWMAMGYKFGDTAQQYYEANSHKIKLTEQQTEFIYVLFTKLKEHNEHTNQKATKGFLSRILPKSWIHS